MAQIDTGLGWSAKDGWLIQTPGVIGNIAELTGGLKLPQGDTIADCAIGGVVIGTRAVPYGTPSVIHNIQIKLMSVEYPAVVASITSSNMIEYLSVSLASGNHIIRVDYDTFDDTYSGGIYSMTSFQSKYIHNHVISASILPQWTGNPAVTDYPNANALMSSISELTSNITKDNAGFSVACLARWKTSAQVVINTPILISSDTNFVDMSEASGSYNLAKLNRLHEGVNFKMSFFDITGNTNVSSPLPLLDLTGEADPAYSLPEIFDIIASSEYANIEVIYSPDPYQEGDGSEEGGADGEEDEEDDVGFTDPPSTSIGATGFLTIFCPSLTELRSLATFMWSSFDVDNWRKLFANPMDAILGLHIIPVPANITGTKAVKVGGIDTTIDMSYTTLRYIRRPMGTCEIPKKWGAYLDYSPYTKVSIFLPYIGFKELDADDIMGKTIALQYIIDILTGACVAELKCGDTVLYSWQGNCANEVPISGSDWRGAISSALGIAATVATTVATGGATAPMVAGTIASVGANSLNLKPTINRSGSISGSAGFISNQRPYIIRSVPNLVIPTDQNKFIGYPSFVTASLGSLTGYNEISSIHLEGIPATGNELAEIETLLKGGVIL